MQHAIKIDGQFVIFDAEKAELLGSSRGNFCDVELYKAPSGGYFKIETSEMLERSEVTTFLDTEAALGLFNKLQTREADFLSAFPDVEFRDA